MYSVGGRVRRHAQPSVLTPAELLDLQASER